MASRMTSHGRAAPRPLPPRADGVRLPSVDTSALNFPVHHWLVANLACGYRLEPSSVGRTSVTLRINNLLNTKPPISDDVFGYNVTMFNDRGRFSI
jgi:outer membrane receptor protein involved in Fe transport